MPSPDLSGHEPGRAVVPAAMPLAPVRDPYAPPGGHQTLDDGPGLGEQVWDYWRVIVKRRRLIVALAALVLVLGTVRTLMLTPIYTATVRLQIDRTTARVVENGQVVQADSQDSDFMKTQYELLMSRAIAERTASALKLGSDDDLFRPREFSIVDALRSFLVPRDGSGVELTQLAAREKTAAAILQTNRGIRPIGGSRLVDLLYSDHNPQRAQRVVMAIADAYIATNLDKRFEANAYAKTFLEDQIKQLKLRLEESEKTMLDFAQKEQIVATTEKASIAESNLASANAALGVLISDRIKNEQLWRQVEAATIINLPQLLTNSVIDGLRGRKNALTTEYQEKIETFKPEYPAMIQIRNKLREIDRQLEQEVRTIKSSYKAAYEAALKQEAEMKTRIDELKKDFLDLQQRSIQYNILKRDVDSNRALHESLLQRFKQVDVAGGVDANNVFIVDKAEVPGSPSSPNLSRSVVLSLLMGLGAGVGLALLLEQLDNTIHGPAELERATHLPILGVIPNAPAGTDVFAELSDPRSGIGEAYRSLATALQFSTDSGLPRTLFVTSSGPGEAKSTTAVALATHFARLGLKVLLVDADLRKPSVHTKLRLENAIGLSNVLTSACDYQDALLHTELANLAVMTSGPVPPSPTELLGSARLVALLTTVSDQYHFVIIDGPPVMGIADALIVSGATAATLFVAGAGVARANSINEAFKRLRQSRSHVVGAALTRFDAMEAGYGYGGQAGYGHYSSSGYGYGQKPSELLESRSP